MTVLVTARFAIDPNRLETVARENSETLHRIRQSAKDHGLISHRFYGNDEGVLVVDHWPDEESFRRFFAETSDIGDLMGKSGATGEPAISFYRLLDVDDAVAPTATIA